MKVVGFAGYSGAGKTTLVEQVVRELRARGQSVSVIKHAHHSFDVDQPGKDSWRHRQAGAYEVLLVSQRRMALLREWELAEEPHIDSLLPELGDVDWALVEGFKFAPICKLEVWRASVGKPAHYPDDPFMVAVVTDDAAQLPAPTARPVLDINRPAEVVDFLLREAQRFEHAG
ncbi:MAG: molybdopterin-guanine dinucleotide biosynthesis protein B [Betaproteobacteria bacterium]|nr:molybdopterin-guanine dinucleotide biosynthesis protein B [Betaproteobacteria bacterium]